jgi:tetratricopeptide (TPR) repeat protein
VLTVIVPTGRPSATPLPPTPTPTATPIFNSAAPYRVAIARFNQLSERKLGIEQRLEDDLEQQLQDAGLLDEVEVKVVTQPSIESAEDAQNLARATNSNVVVWGLYDDVGIRLRVLLGPGVAITDTAPQVTRFGELPLVASGAETTNLSFYITSTLPANTSFLSLYVIGHLYYLSNQYTKGYAAFDAATARLPQTVAVENEALLHFFNGRSIKPQTITDTVSAACEYAQALAIDPQMFEAYLNLGVLLRAGESEAIATAPCMRELVNTFRPLSADALFRIVRQFKPDLGIVWYNLGALDWGVNQRAEAVDSFQQAIQLDPSIAEAYLPLGNAAIEQRHFTEAIDYFEQALKLRPHWPEAQINLGQALALAGRETEAEAVFRQVAATAPSDSPAAGEAHLLLGSLYQRRGDLESAAQAYRAAEEWLTSPQSSGRSFMSSALNLLQAKYAIDTGNWLSATERLSVEYPSTMQVYVLHLLNQLQPELAVTTPALTEALSSTLNVEPPLTLWIGTHETDWLVMADVLSRCQATSLRELDTLTCLPAAPAKRLEAIYDTYQYWLHHRVFYNDSTTALGMACPYLFTYDEQAGRWEHDTTVLYHLVGPQAEKVQERPLQRFDGRLWLREIEPETSYVDLIAVRLITAGGREIVLKSAIPSLSVDDGQYLKLQPGEEQLLQFDVPPDALPVRAAWVIAAGYYVPHLLDESR